MGKETTVKIEDRKRSHYMASNKMEDMHGSFIKINNLNRRRVPKAKLYNEILTVLFSKIFKAIILEGYEFRFRNLGMFSLIKFKPKIKLNKDGKIITNKNINFKESYKLRKETGNRDLWVYFDNKETGGFIYKMLWDLSSASFINNTFYKFQLAEVWKKLIHTSAVNGTAMARTIDVKL